jgi:actin-related protein
MYKSKWKPNASQRKEFAQRMQDPDEKTAFEERKAAKKQKFYDSIHEQGIKSYIPSREQHDFCMFERPDNLTSEQENACNLVASGFILNEKVDHYFIHIVNELRRKINL